MKQRINFLTLGVNDLEKSLKFFRDAFGWQSKGIIGTEFERGAIVLFDLDGGMMVSLYERKNLAWDSGLEMRPESGTEFSVGHLVNTEAEVDAIMKQAEKAGAKIVKPAQKTFWGGYGGHFKDIDGHLWEIAHNPAFKIKE
ncbi:MAG: VOC family protein [Bacteroidetes bacterium]|nr:VOC family protein [Bacteroidota bacterium]